MRSPAPRRGAAQRSRRDSSPDSSSEERRPASVPAKPAAEEVTRGDYATEDGSALPHDSQNVPLDGFGAPQWGHVIGPICVTLGSL